MSSQDDLRPADGSVERDVLLCARAGLSPSAADGDRVRRALAAALAAAPAASTAAPASAPKATRLARRAGSWGGRLIAGATIAAVAGSAGYLIGQREGRNAAAIRVAAMQAPPAVQVPAPAAEPAPPASLAPVHPAPVASLPARKHAPKLPAPEAPAPSLEAEVRGVRAIERALREGSPSLALALLAELDRTVPGGRLVEERAATRAIAQCALGRVPFGVDLAAEFGDRYPDSAYLKRVHQSCAKASAAATD